MKKSKKIVTHTLSQEVVEMLIKEQPKLSLNDMLNIIIHNQGIINEKLNKKLR